MAIVLPGFDPRCSTNSLGPAPESGLQTWRRHDQVPAQAVGTATVTGTMTLDWTACPADPLPWFQLREPLLQLLLTPALVVPLLTALAFLLVWSTALLAPWRWLMPATVLLFSVGLYSPLGTQLLSSWLTAQLPPPAPTAGTAPLAVLVGRGPQIAAATTAAAAALERSGAITMIYVSGDTRSTAEQLVRIGVPPSRLAGDSCARTTWENATRTSDWIRAHHLPPRITLITDPWQLPRASRAFMRQGISVIAIAAAPQLSPRESNRLAIRETVATMLYNIQGRT